MRSLWEPLFSVVSPSLSGCRSVALHSASSTSFQICSLLLHLFLSPRHMLARSPRAHTRAHKDSLAGTVSILKGLSVSISQQPCPRGCVLPTLLPREELWWSANRFPLSLSCYSAPGFTPACKINLWPIPSLGSRILYHETGENKERAASRSRGQEPYLASKRGERGDVQVVVAPRVVPLCAAALSATVRLLSPRSKVLGWRWISMEMKMTPRSARIMHVTSEYF